jgi:hypothetical protein
MQLGDFCGWWQVALPSVLFHTLWVRWFSWMYVFAMVPNLRINSRETWFTFNLRRKMNKLVTHPAYYFLSLQRIMNIMTYLSTFIHTWAAIPCSTSWIRPSWPCPQVRLSPSLAHTYLVSSLFVLAHQVACCLSSDSYFKCTTLPFTTRRLNTFIQVNIMGAWYNIYNRYNM